MRRALSKMFAMALGAVVFAPGIAEAESEGKLRLEHVLTSARRAFPGMEASRAEVDAARADLLNAEGKFDLKWRAKGAWVPLGYYENQRAETYVEQPTKLWGTSVFAGYRVGRGSYAVYDGRLQTLDYGEARGGVGIPIWRDGPIDERRAKIQKAEIGVRVGQAGLQAQQLDVEFAAAEKYWKWIGARLRRNVADDLLKLALARDVQIKARVESGDLEAIEITDNERTIVKRRAQLAEADGYFQRSAFELALYLRDERGQPRFPRPSECPDALPDPALPPIGDVKSESSLAIMRRPDLKKLELKSEALVIERQLAKNQLGPTLDLMLVGARDFGPAIASRPDLSHPTFEAQLVFELPIQRREARGMRDRAEADLRRVRFERKYKMDRINTDVASAIVGMQASLQKAQATHREVELSKKLAQAERDRYALGSTTVFIVNLREQAAAEAAVREIDALVDFQLARLEYRIVTARGAG